MKIKVISRFGKPSPNDLSTIYLTWDDWNDFSFCTLFGMYYVDLESRVHEIGSIKIGYFGQKEGFRERKLSIGDVLDELDNTHFSLGQSDMFYENLNKLGVDTRDLILYALKDIAINDELYKRAINEPVTTTSLLRTVSPSTVKSQFKRLLTGGARLTEYNFNFIAPKIREDSSCFDLSFQVKPESFPPTNIHVLIGRNGVGKTHLTNNMINSLLEGNYEENGIFEFIDDESEGNVFANLVSISFSAFDKTAPRPEIKDKTKGIKYSYIGLKQLNEEKANPPTTKDTPELTDEFYNSLKYCRSSRKNRWKEGIEMLESDPNFKDAEIKSLIDIEKNNEFRERVYNIFDRLSSGHKIVLLTITRLIETLQEKSLVLIDEPEAHLHPPLLSAFTRALSKLLITTNGVALIATHSPVILQEVPKNCAWKLRRTGAEAISERLKTETFGESVGILTNEVFGLEVTNSGFYTLLDDVAKKKNSYEEVLEHFGGQLGMEARAILMTYFA